MNQEDINKDQKETNKQLFDHAKIANEEMASIKIDMAIVKTDIGYLKKGFDSIEPKVDSLQMTIHKYAGGIAVLTILMGLVVKFIK